MADVGVFICRGTKEQIDAIPRVDGQILFNTDTDLANRIYADLPDGRRIVIGGTVEVDSEFSAVSTNPLQNKVVTSHVNNHNNPHNVTKFQIGLGNVENTSDADKYVGGVLYGGARLSGVDINLGVSQAWALSTMLNNLGVNLTSVTLNTEDSRVVQAFSDIRGGYCTLGKIVFVSIELIGTGDGWGDKNVTIMKGLPVPLMDNAVLANASGENLRISKQGFGIMNNGWGGTNMYISGCYIKQ